MLLDIVFFCLFCIILFFFFFLSDFSVGFFYRKFSFFIWLRLEEELFFFGKDLVLNWYFGFKEELLVIFILYLLFLEIMFFCFESMAEEFFFIGSFLIEFCDLEGFMDIEDILIWRLEEDVFLDFIFTVVGAFFSRFLEVFSFFRLVGFW